MKNVQFITKACKIFFSIYLLSFSVYSFAQKPYKDDVTQVRLEKNKQTVVAFYDLMFNKNKPAEAIKLYVGDTYIQHNPHVKDGKQGFIDYFNKMTKEYPNKKVTFKKILADGDFVILHCFQEWPGDHNYAGIDIFRLDDNGKIVEHWDVLQTIPVTARNSNSMF